MPTCAAGHDSAATDYCDVCGLSLQAPAAGAAPTGVAPAPSATVTTAAAAGVCDNCGAPRAAGEKFCEVCGLDVGTGKLPQAPAAKPAAAPAAAPTTPTAPLTTWTLTVTCDPDWYADNAGGSAEGIELPDPLPDPREVPLPSTAVVGRAGATTRPDIALDDDAVSRRHLELRQEVTGGWVVTDLGSTNGTYLDDATDPIPTGEHRAVSAGSRLKVGAYTVLTLRD